MAQGSKIITLVRRTFLAVLAIYFAVAFGIFSYFTYQRDFVTGLFTADLMVGTGLFRRLNNPIESDVAIINKFARDRTSYEQLVELHRKQCFSDADPATNSFGEYPEVKLLKEKLGIVQLQSGTGAYWLPDPYSHDAQVSAGTLRNELLASPSPMRHRRSCRYTAPRFYLGAYGAHLSRKGLIYFPAAPKVKDGMLLRPRPAGDPVKFEKVLPSLDRTWPWLPRLTIECVYRRIEPQWFLFLC